MYSPSWFSTQIKTWPTLSTLYGNLWQKLHTLSFFFCQRASLYSEIMSDSVRRVLSAAFASQCSDLTSSLCLQRGPTPWIQNQPVKSCSFFSFLAALGFKKQQIVRIWTLRWSCLWIPLAFLQLYIYQAVWRSFFSPLKLLLPHHYLQKRALSLQISWPNCARWCICRCFWRGGGGAKKSQVKLSSLGLFKKIPSFTKRLDYLTNITEVDGSLLILPGF